jgi:hypothetical protein
LLRNGATIKSPKPAEHAAADHLASLGLIDFDLVQVVLCANPEDADYGRGHRNCAGRIVVADDHEDSKAELCCPICDRRIYPDHFDKRRLTELRPRVSREGATTYCEGLLAEVDPSFKAVADGAYRLDLGGKEVFACLIDFLTDGMYWSQTWAEMNPACFVAVNPNHTRFGEGEWLTRVSLAELVCGDVVIRDVLESAAANGRPRGPNMSVALFGKGPAHTVAEPARPSASARQFVVEVGPNVVRVDGETVVPANAKPRHRVFRILWQWFLDDLRSGRSAEEFRAWTIDRLMEELASQAEKRETDEGNVRRIINNLQNTIAESLKRKVGTPINREDIVQSCSDGYRINPYSVVARPFQPDLS